MYKVKVNDKEFRVEDEQESVRINDNLVDADVLEIKERMFHVIRNHQSYLAELLDWDKEEKSFSIRVNKNVYQVSVKDKYDELLTEMGMDFASGKKVNEIKAPMPGLVLNILVQNGQEIKKGDAILVLEAMKMENVLKSPSDGVIRKIHVIKGDKVEKNQVMINFA